MFDLCLHLKTPATRQQLNVFDYITQSSVCIFDCNTRVCAQASSKDIESYFVGFGVSWIEWLNGLSLNVLFEDKFTAARALETLSQPIMPVEGVCINVPVLGLSYACGWSCVVTVVQ